MPKLNLSRTYCWGGTDYGPGNVDVPDKHSSGLSPYEDIKAKEDAYQKHLADGGEPAAPITPSMVSVGGKPEGMTALPPAQGKPAAAAKPAAKVPAAPTAPPAAPPATEPK